jgi:hypothetical protein
MTANIEMILTQKALTISPGEKAEVSVSLRNRGQTVDQLSLKIEGLDPNWYALPVSSVALFPNDQDTLKIVLNLPEKLDSKIPSYKLQVTAASQENPQGTVSASIDIIIKSVPKAEISILPFKAVGRKGIYQLIVNNPGSSELRIQLKAQDSLGKLNFVLQPDSISVPANGHIEASLSTQLKLFPYILSGEKEIDFQVSALCPGETTAEGCGLAAAVLVNEPWYRFLTKLKIPWLSRPPQIVSFESVTDDRREFKLNWQTRKAAQVKLDGADIETKGSTVVRPTEDKEYVLEVANKFGTAVKKVQVKPIPLPKAKALPRIKLSISQSQLQVQAGGVPVQINVDVQNLGETVDKFMVEVEGLDESWFTRSASSIALMPKATDQVQISFQPPKKKPVKSGLYPFGVTVRSQSVAGEAATVVGQLEILPAVEYKLKVQPYRVQSSKKGVFRVNLANMNVSQSNINLEATDLEENCEIQFENSKPMLAAWNTIEIPMTVKPKVGRMVGDLRRFEITVTATGPDGIPQTANCEFTHKPMMANWKWVIRLVKLLIVIAIIVVAVYFILKLGGGWDAFIKSPKTWINNVANTIEGWFSR